MRNGRCHGLRQPFPRAGSYLSGNIRSVNSCPAVSGRRGAGSLGGGQEGRLRISKHAPQSTLRHRCLTLNSAKRQEWVVCRTVILTNLLPNVETLPKIGPAGLMPQTHGLVGMLSAARPTGEEGQAGAGVLLVRAVN